MTLANPNYPNNEGRLAPLPHANDEPALKSLWCAMCAAYTLHGEDEKRIICFRCGYRTDKKYNKGLLRAK